MTSYKKLYLDLQKKIAEEKERKENQHRKELIQKFEREKQRAEEEKEHIQKCFSAKPSDIKIEEGHIKWNLPSKSGYLMEYKKFLDEKQSIEAQIDSIKNCRHEKLDIYFNANVSGIIHKKFEKDTIITEFSQEDVDYTSTKEIRCRNCKREFNPKLDHELDWNYETFTKEDMEAFTPEQKDVMGINQKEEEKDSQCSICGEEGN